LGVRGKETRACGKTTSELGVLENCAERRHRPKCGCGDTSVVAALVVSNSVARLRLPVTLPISTVRSYA